MKKVVNCYYDGIRLKNNQKKSDCLTSRYYASGLIKNFDSTTAILEYDCDKVCCIVKRNGGEKGIYQKIEISPTITTDYAHQTNSYGLPHVIDFEME